MTRPISRSTIILPYVMPFRNAQSSTPIFFTLSLGIILIRWISRKIVVLQRGIPTARMSFFALFEEHNSPCCITIISHLLVLLRYLKTSLPGCSAKVFFPHIGLWQKNFLVCICKIIFLPKIGKSVMTLLYLLWTLKLILPQ